MHNQIDVADIQNTVENATLKEIVTNNFRTAAVFEKYGLDFCCRGNKLISVACEEKGINPEPVYQDLKDLSSRATREERYDTWAPDFMIDYIINNHHSYVLDMIPIIGAHINKVANVHGENHPEVIEIAKKFNAVAEELLQHMQKEENLLFPYIKLLWVAKTNNNKADAADFGSVNNPISEMLREHENAGDELYSIRELSREYDPPEDACNTYRAAYQELKDFEEDLHKHVHLENNILFPKAVDLEKELLG